MRPDSPPLANIHPKLEMIKRCQKIQNLQTLMIPGNPKLQE